MSSKSRQQLVGRSLHLPSGRRLRLMSILGQGAYGTVYLGVDCTDNSKFAVKHLKDSHLSPAQRVLQRQEARLHLKCSAHPSILKLEEVVEASQGHGWFMVMEFCEEHDLFDYITGGALANEHNIVGAAKGVFHQLCDAVHYMHMNRVYHRDLKPENIMLRKDAQGRPSIRVGDFGLATEDRINADRGCGSDFYMAPESRRVSNDVERELEAKLNYQRCAYDPEKADVWALGILLCNLACGRNPWNQASLTDAGFMHYLRSPRTALMDLLPITEQLNNALIRALAINPAHRPSVAELYKMVMEIRGRFRRVGVPFGAVKADPGYIDTDMVEAISKTSTDISEDECPKTPDNESKEVSQWTAYFGKDIDMPSTPSADQVATSTTTAKPSSTRLNQLLGLVA